MALALFAFIAWVIITVFCLIPKRLLIEENITLFFIYNIIVINIYTILDLDLKLITPNNETDMFISLWLHRNIIIPLSLIIFVNLVINSTTRIRKSFTSVVAFLILYFIEVLTLWVNIKTYSGWNLYLTAVTMTALMLVAFMIMKLITKLPERKLI